MFPCCVLLCACPTKNHSRMPFSFVKRHISLVRLAGLAFVWEALQAGGKVARGYKSCNRRYSVSAVSARASWEQGVSSDSKLSIARSQA